MDPDSPLTRGQTPSGPSFNSRPGWKETGQPSEDNLRALEGEGKAYVSRRGTRCLIVCEEATGARTREPGPGPSSTGGEAIWETFRAYPGSSHPGGPSLPLRPPTRARPGDTDPGGPGTGI